MSWQAQLKAINWLPAVFALALTAFGVAFVISACYDPDAAFGLGPEAKKQIVWFVIGLGACTTVALVPLSFWRQAAVPAYVACLVVQGLMIAAAGSSLVPRVKGAHNWLVLGPLTIQPSEFIKLGVLLCCARAVAATGFDVRRLSHLAGVLAIAAVPALLLAREDLGSALTFPPLAIGMLFLAGMRPGHLAGLAATTVAVIVAGVLMLPKEGPKAYQYHRIQAWWDPDRYRLTEAYQTTQAMHSIGSGQWTGAGYLEGNLNRLGWLPEKHTDLIFAVIGEESGFLGSTFALILFLGFGCAGIACAAASRDAFARALIGGFSCLIMGQAMINLAVVLGLMPVTGITLPFMSYGGSSLLGSWLGVGLVLSATAARGQRDSVQWR